MAGVIVERVGPDHRPRFRPAGLPWLRYLRHGEECVGGYRLGRRCWVQWQVSTQVFSRYREQL